MAHRIYRDTLCADGADASFELLTRLLAHGWNAVAWGSGAGGARFAAASPASAADLRAGPNAWWMVQHASTGVRLSLRLAGTLYAWHLRYTEATMALALGDAETPDSDPTYTRNLFGPTQAYPTSGTTATRTHTVVDDASPGFVMLTRRSPYVGGSCCALVYFERVTPVTWAANPQPYVGGGGFDDSNNASVVVVSPFGSTWGWVRRGLSGEAWVPWALENPGNVAGTGVLDPSGEDLEVDARWVRTDYLLGASRLFRLLQPYRGPTTGLDSGGTLTRAAFGHITVPNDGLALGS